MHHMTEAAVDHTGKGLLVRQCEAYRSAATGLQLEMRDANATEAKALKAGTAPVRIVPMSG